MKQKLESTFIILFIISILMNIFHFSGADLIALFSLGIASIYYYGFTLFILLDISIRNALKKETYSGISPILILSCIIIGWDYSVLILGVLFKYLLLPGNSFMLVTGLFMITIMTAVGFFFIRKKQPLVFDRFMRRTLVISGFALVFHVLPAEKIIDMKWSEHPNYANALKEQYNNPNDSTARHNVEMEFEKIDNPNRSD